MVFFFFFSEYFSILFALTTYTQTSFRSRYFNTININFNARYLTKIFLAGMMKYICVPWTRNSTNGDIASLFSNWRIQKQVNIYSGLLRKLATWQCIKIFAESISLFVTYFSLFVIIFLSENNREILCISIGNIIKKGMSILKEISRICYKLIV